MRSANRYWEVACEDDPEDQPLRFSLETAASTHRDNLAAEGRAATVRRVTEAR